MKDTCEECGSTDRVEKFYGRETCDKSDLWYGCWDCRWSYFRHRLHGPDATGPPGSVETPESGEKGREGQSTLGSFS